MNQQPFHDEVSLAEAAENLGKQAMAQGLIPSFVVRHFPDSKEFYIPNETAAPVLTPEEAYLHFKKLLAKNS